MREYKWAYLRFQFMTCYRPLQGIRFLDGSVHVLGKKSTFELTQRFKAPSNLFPLPCGKCIGCRLSYSRNWAIRIMHEVQMMEESDATCSFVTLTYDDYFNDLNRGSLNYLQPTNFIKRLRKSLSENLSDYGFIHNPDIPFRYFYCGEYGSRTFRPHYHFIFFNLGFSDAKKHSRRNSYDLFTSDSLDFHWSEPWTKTSYGHHLIGNVSVESAAYVARYNVKKALQGNQLLYFNQETGEHLQSERTFMSRRPGIAYSWWMKYRKFCQDDKIVLPNGFVSHPPRYYDQLLEQTDPDTYKRIKDSRLLETTTPAALSNSTTSRLIVREQVKLSQVGRLERVL